MNILQNELATVVGACCHIAGGTRSHGQCESLMSRLCQYE